MVKKFFIHLGFSLLLAILFLLPDLIYKLVENNYFILRLSIYKDLSGFFIINFIVLLIPSFRLKFAFYIFFFLLSFIQLFHYSFFHSLIMPYEVLLAFTQMDEILDTLSNTIRFMTIPFLIFSFQIIFIYIVLKGIHDKVLKLRFAGLIILVILSIGPISAYNRASPYIYMPRIESSSIKNLYNVLSWVLSKEIVMALSEQKPEKNFLPYTVIPNTIAPEKLPRNVIVVMGESLTSKRMSFFGYPIENTPKLEQLKQDKNFFYGKGFSGSVTTDVSLPTFFSLKREPENIKEFLTGNTNLLKIAKAQGYKTHYITTQKLTIFGNFLGKHADVITSLDDFQTNSKDVVFDDVLLEYLSKIDFNSKNFIILHQRNSHTPYDKHTPKEFLKYDIANKNFKEYMHNAYMNSLLYTDDLMNRMIDHLKKQTSSSVFFMTSDHGEILGSEDENGKFGHTYLEFDVAKVPFFIYGHLVDDTVKIKFEQLNEIKSHYEFGKLILNTLGQDLHNPNEDGRFFINGIEITGKQGFLEYR